MKRILYTILLCVLTYGISFGGGFGIYEFGAAASSMAGTGVANPWDASTIFYNPSGLVHLKGFQFYGGTSIIVSESKFTGANPTLSGEQHSTDNKIFPPIGVYASAKFGEKFAAGIGVTNPFGLGVRWKSNFPGRYVSQESELASFYISPVISYALTEEFSIGGGVDVVTSNVDLRRSVYLFDSQNSIGYEVAQIRLDGKSDPAVGFTASFLYRTDKGGFGFLYRHQVKQEFKNGDAAFTFFDNLSVPQAQAIAKANLEDQKISTEVTYPNIATVGVYHRPFEKFGYEIDVLWWGWKKVDILILNFEELGESEIVLNYSNRFQLRAGVHYDATEKLTLRGGYIYDQTPQPVETMGPLLPDADRHDFAFGLGYTFGKVWLDVGYMAVNWDTRSTVKDGEGQNQDGFDGAYDSKANLFFISLGVGTK
jgi:long-chain fatty acid transport protein